MANEVMFGSTIHNMTSGGIQNSTNTDWMYTVHPYDVHSDTFGPFSAIIDLVRKRIKPGASMASWADLDFYDFVGWHSAVCLKEIVPGNFDLRIRLFGTYFVECFDADLTGRMLSDLPEQSRESNQRDVLHYKKICEAPCIGLSYGPATWLKKQHRHFTILGIPLANDGINASHALSLMRKTSAEAPLEPID